MRVRNAGFTLIELLVVIAIVAVLAAIMMPVFARAKLRAQVSRVHSDLRQVAAAVELYEQDFKGLPPVRESCKENAAIDYYELPRELHQMKYLSTRRMHDPFNTVRGEDGQELRRTYKFTAINWGYSNDSLTRFAMWIPEDYPNSRKDALLYYRSGNQYYAFPPARPKAPPVTWAVWSVGPSGDPGWTEAGNRHLPVPKREWYPYKEKGVIVHLSDGRTSP